MGQVDMEEKVKGQNLARMILIVKRIERELDQLKNLINLQNGSSSSTTANCDGNPDPDTSIIKDDSFYLGDTVKIEDDLISITNEDPDYEYGGVNNNQEEEFNDQIKMIYDEHNYAVVNNYNVQELKEDQVNSRNRPSNEDELILQGGLDFNFEIIKVSSIGEAHVDSQSSSFTTNFDETFDKILAEMEEIHGQEEKQIVVKEVEDCSVDLKSDAHVVDSLHISKLKENNKEEIHGQDQEKQIVHQEVEDCSALDLKPADVVVDSLHISKLKENQFGGDSADKNVNKLNQKLISQAQMGQSKSKSKSKGKSKINVKSKEKPRGLKLRQSKIKICNGFNSQLTSPILHHGEKSFTCTVCPKAFFHKSDLKKHSRSHGIIITSIKKKLSESYKCKICPTTRLTSREELTAHYQSHSAKVDVSSKIFECQICPKVFQSVPIKGDLSSRSRSRSRVDYDFARHMRGHLGNLYECPTCLRKFSTRRNLTDHLRVHTGEKPYSCSECRKNFSQCGSLARHKKNFHK